MPHKLKYTEEQLLNLSRSFNIKHGRPPRMNEFPGGLQRTIRKRIGPWRVYLQKSLGALTHHRTWSREEMIAFAKKFWSEYNRYPTNDDTIVAGRNIRNAVIHCFGSANEWLEESIGTSPRIEILHAISDLTPPGCDEATPREILAHIRKKMEFPTNLLGFNTCKLAEQGYLIGGRFDRTNWWKLTQKGNVFLKSFVGARHDVPSSSRGEKI